MKKHQLADRVESLKMRVRAIHAAAGIGWGVLAGTAALVAGGWVDLAVDLPPVARLFIWVAAAVLAFLPLLAAIQRAAALATTAAVSRSLDVVARTHGEIHAGVDLLLNPTVAIDGVGEGFRNLAIQRAGGLARSIPGSYVVSADPLLRPILILFGTAITFAIFAIVAPRIAGTEFVRFTDPYGDHPPYSPLIFSVDPGNAKVLYASNLPINVTVAGGAPNRLDLVVYSEDSKTSDSLPMFPDLTKGWQATVTNVVAPGWYVVKAGTARSTRFKLDVITVPKIESARVRIAPPAYTNLPPYEGQIPPGGIVGLPGTRVDLFLKSNRPLSGGQVQFALENKLASIPLKPLTTGHAELEVTGTFILSLPGRLSAKVTDVAGQGSVDALAANLVVTEDQRPFVRILQPLAQSYATPNIELPVELSAEDDYGISRLQLYRGINDSSNLPQELTVPKPAPTRLPSTTVLPLSAYGLNPGDTIKLFAHVEDTNPAGPGMSDSSVVVVTIISEAQMQQMILARQSMETLQSKYDQANRRIEELNSQIAALEKEMPSDQTQLNDEQRKKILALADAAEKEAQAVRDAGKEDLPFDLDKALRKNVDEVANAINTAKTTAQKMAGQPGMTTAGAKGELKDMLAKLQGEQKDYQEQATDPLQRLAEVFSLQEDQAKFEQMYEKQRDLEMRLHAMRDKNGEDNPELKNQMRSMEEEQRGLRQDLQKLLDDIDTHVAQLPADLALDDLHKSAQAFSKAARESTIVEEMASSESGLSQFSGLLGHAGAKAAADLMKDLLSQCHGMGTQASNSLKFQPRLAAGLGNTVEQMLEAEGLGSKTGTGQGGSGGYSMNRNSLQNVGLYGRLPNRAQVSKLGGGHADHGANADSWGRDNKPGATDIVNNHGRQRAAGGSDASVPSQYRKQVGDYFQRVADDLGEKQ